MEMTSGIKYLVLYVNTMQKLSLSANRREAIKATKKSIKEILEHLVAKTMVCIENLSTSFTSNLQDLLELIGDYKDVYLALDIAHAYVSFTNK